MDLAWTINQASTFHRKIPERFFLTYESQGFAKFPSAGGTDSTDLAWVAGRFCPNSDNILYLGDDLGNIAVVDVRAAYGTDVEVEGGMLSCFKSHQGCVMDIYGVPGRPNQLLTVGGNSAVRLWDFEHQNNEKPTIFWGHDGTVRTACFAPDSSSVFASGGRDGQIRVWDTRQSSVMRDGIEVKNSKETYLNTHGIRDVKGTNKGTPSRNSKVSGKPSPSVTSLVFIDDNLVASSAENSSSGIRIWDIRKPPTISRPSYVSLLNIPTSNGERGVASICVDRHGSSLFVAVLDNVVYEYAVATSNVKPIRCFGGGSFSTFFAQIATSPISDHLMGTNGKQAVLWDLQPFHRYLDEEYLSDDIQKERAKMPVFILDGHDNDSDVTSVGWSAKGTYMLTLDEWRFRIWDSRPKTDKIESLSVTNMENSDRRCLKKFALSTEDQTTHFLNSIRLSPRIPQRVFGSPTKTPGSKRKVPFHSPIKGSNIFKTPTKSPSAKYSRISPSRVMSDISNQEPTTPGSARKKRKKLPFNPFYARYPTANLPNTVYDRYVRRLKDEKDPAVLVTSPDCSSRKCLVDFWSRSGGEGKPERLQRLRVPSSSEFGESVCANVMAEIDRKELESPKKLYLKAPGGPKPSRAKTHLSALKEEVPRRRSNRNLLDYFNKV